MTGRRTFGLATSLVVAVASLAALHSVPATGQDKKPESGSRDEHHEAYERCAKACNDCQRVCDTCATHCARQVADGKKEHDKTLQTCNDCADFCAAAARIVARGGPFADLICQSCAEACARCGKACEQFPDDKMMKACAKECRRCEKECQGMLKHVAKGDEKK